MPPNRKARTSRNGGIPGDFILNWRNPGAGMKKPVVRRPMTACEGCRMAKAKCNGQPTCSRCIDRGLVCTYATPAPPTPARSEASTRDDNYLACDAVWPSPIQFTVGNDSPDFNISALEPSPPDHTVYEPEVGTEPMPAADWAGEIAVSGSNLDWGLIDASVSVSSRNEQCYSPWHDAWRLTSSKQACESLDQTDPSNLSMFPAMDIRASHSTSYENDGPVLRGGCIDRSWNSTSTLPSSSLSPERQSTIPAKCLCRASLTLYIPSVAAAMQEKELDQVFKVTGDMIQACQDLVDCITCQVSCTDLLMMTTVLQETYPCFDHVSQHALFILTSYIFHFHKANYLPVDRQVEDGQYRQGKLWRV